MADTAPVATWDTEDMADVDANAICAWDKAAAGSDGHSIADVGRRRRDCEAREIEEEVVADIGGILDAVSNVIAVVQPVGYVALPADESSSSRR